MDDDLDFVALYDELGIDPDCSFAEFRRAYRRRVAMLHPDHPSHSSDTTRLQRLNRLYAAAIDFERKRGRLPGSTRPQVPGRREGRRQQLPGVDNRSPENALSGAMHKPRYLILATLVLVALYSMGANRAANPRLDPEGSADAAPAGAAEVAVPRVTLGMERALVLRIQGSPLRDEESRWHYGPSWIDFNCGQVVGWYSSPLEPLRVDERQEYGTRQAARQTFHRC